MAKILIIDDETRLLTLYSAILVREGHEVWTASTAEGGFELAVSGKPDLVLLDVMMPVADGLDAFDRLSGNSVTQQLPVVFLTSLIREDEVAQAGGRIKGRDYISKSTPVPKFIERINQVLAIPRPPQS